MICLSIRRYVREAGQRIDGTEAVVKGTQPDLSDNILNMDFAKIELQVLGQMDIKKKRQKYYGGTS